MSEGTKSIFREGSGVSDEGIDLSDIPELSEEFFRRAELRGPMVQMYSALIEREVYEWFQAQGPDYMQRINRLLREHMESRQAGTLQSQPR